MTPRLSILIPFYNETAYLRMAVWSVLAQGIDGIEVIVVNDNPAAFGEGDIRGLGLPDSIRVLCHDRNRGLSAARNTAIAAATAPVIGFLDADDYYTAGGLARQLACAEATGACMTHGMAYLTRGGSPAVQVLARDAALHGRAGVWAGLQKLEKATEGLEDQGPLSVLGIAVQSLF